MKVYYYNHKTNYHLLDIRTCNVSTICDRVATEYDYPIIHTYFTLVGGVVMDFGQPHEIKPFFMVFGIVLFLDLSENYMLWWGKQFGIVRRVPNFRVIE